MLRTKSPDPAQDLHVPAALRVLAFIIQGMGCPWDAGDPGWGLDRKTGGDQSAPPPPGRAPVGGQLAWGRTEETHWVSPDMAEVSHHRGPALGTSPHPRGYTRSPKCEYVCPAVTPEPLQGGLQPQGCRAGGHSTPLPGPKFLNKAVGSPHAQAQAQGQIGHRASLSQQTPGSSGEAWRTQPAVSASSCRGGWLGHLGEDDEARG